MPLSLPRRKTAGVTGAVSLLLLLLAGCTTAASPSPTPTFTAAPTQVATVGDGVEDTATASPQPTPSPTTTVPTLTPTSSPTPLPTRLPPRSNTPFVSLDDPLFLTAREATYLPNDDLVLGVLEAGEARAYPVRMMRYHHIVNDTIGGTPTLVTY